MFTGTVKVKLPAPLKWEDKEISVIDLDFSKVTGAIINKCERDTYSGVNFPGVIRGANAEYCSRMASAISGVSFRALEKLPADDYDVVWQTVGAFVNKGDPQEFYEKYLNLDKENAGEGFTDPAGKPGETEKTGK